MSDSPSIAIVLQDYVRCTSSLCSENNASKKKLSDDEFSTSVWYKVFLKIEGEFTVVEDDLKSDSAVARGRFHNAIGSKLVANKSARSKLVAALVSFIVAITKPFDVTSFPIPDGLSLTAVGIFENSSQIQRNSQSC